MRKRRTRHRATMDQGIQMELMTEAGILTALPFPQAVVKQWWGTSIHEIEVTFGALRRHFWHELTICWHHCAPFCLMAYTIRKNPQTSHKHDYRNDSCKKGWLADLPRDHCIWQTYSKYNMFGKIH